MAIPDGPISTKPLRPLTCTFAAPARTSSNLEPVYVRIWEGALCIRATLLTDRRSLPSTG
jgi:hypothetical protein